MGFEIRLPGTTVSERGDGFTVFDVRLPRGEREIIRFDKHELREQIRSGLKYALNHQGNLPDNEFWNTVADIYDNDRGLFAKTHDCDMLLHLLKVDDRYDRLHPLVPPDVPPNCPPGTPGVPTHPPCPPKFVPEPSSFSILGVGLLMAFIFFKKWRWQ